MTDIPINQIVKRLRAQRRDDSHYEAKECAKKLSRTVWETVSAFANTNGGTIILGLSESTGFTPVAHFDIEKIRDEFISGIGDGGSRSRIANPPRYKIDRVFFEDKPLLVISIDELDPSNKPCYIIDRGIQGGSYKRIDDADIPLTANEIHSLQNACVVQNSDRTVVPDANISDLNEALYQQAFANSHRLTPRAMQNTDSDNERLRRLNFIIGNDQVTKAGLLVAGEYPQQFFPKLCVDVASHPGTTKSSAGQTRFLDRVICEGTIGEMIEEALRALAKNLRIVRVIKGASGTSELEIPEAVLREALTNALVHREYDARFDGESVAVDIYADRVEIVNPGGLWGKSASDLNDGRSCCRNATLMRLLSLTPIPNSTGTPAEGNGSGISFMISETAKRGLEAPQFYPTISHFKVVFKRAQGAVSRKSKVNAEEDLVLALLREYGEMSTREIAQASGLTVNQVRSRLRHLIENKSVEATAASTSRKRTYRPKEK